MPDTLLFPPVTPPHRVADMVRQQGFAVVDRVGLPTLFGCELSALDALCPSWAQLPPDQYLRDGGRYRRRRHSSFIVRGNVLEQVPHRAHWQPLAYNALHGGMERWFEPCQDALLAAPVWACLLGGLGRLCSAIRSAGSSPPAHTSAPWYVEAHQFRIDTTDGIGRPTPEGAHRDGVDFVAVFLIDRHAIKGGETRVFDAHGPSGQRFTLSEPWSMLLLDDLRVIHETTPIQPTGAEGHRDTLVLTLRSAGFQDQ